MHDTRFSLVPINPPINLNGGQELQPEHTAKYGQFVSKYSHANFVMSN